MIANTKQSSCELVLNKKTEIIYLDHVTDHMHDQGAIRVIGKSKGWFFEKDECIGYVPADIADKLVRADMEDKVELRLKIVSIDGTHLIEIRFDILGSKDGYKKYRFAC